MPEVESMIAGVTDGAVPVVVIARTCHGCQIRCSKDSGLHAGYSALKNLGPKRSKNFSSDEFIFPDLSPERLITTALLLYLTPLFGFLVGMVAGNWLALRFAPEASESFTMICGFLGLILVFRCLLSQRLDLSRFHGVPTIRPFP